MITQIIHCILFIYYTTLELKQKIIKSQVTVLTNIVIKDTPTTNNNFHLPLKSL